MAMYQARYKKDCEHTHRRTQTHKNRQYRLPGQIVRQMLILDKAESQDITTVTSGPSAIVSDKMVARQNTRLNKLGISRKISDMFYTLCSLILHHLFP